MKPIALSLSLLVLAGPGACAPGPPPSPPPLILEQTISLPGVAGRIDHLAVDLIHRRVFVAELGNGTVEAIDMATGRPVGRISNLSEPQGLAHLPDRDELAVASGGDGTVRFYHAGDLAPAGVVTVGGDADNLRLTATGQVVVGYGDGALAVIDPASRRVISTTALPAHPEGFRLSGDRAFVNLPDVRKIAVVDLAAGRITATWPAEHRWNYPMALRSERPEIAVVYRLPARLQLRDATSGAVVVDQKTCGDADDVFFDPPRWRLYVICGAGAIDVVTLDAPKGSARIATRSGARTGLFVPEWDRLLVAARAGNGTAALLVYRPSS